MDFDKVIENAEVTYYQEVVSSISTWEITKITQFAEMDGMGFNDQLVKTLRRLCPQF